MRYIEPKLGSPIAIELTESDAKILLLKLTIEGSGRGARHVPHGKEPNNEPFEIYITEDENQAGIDRLDGEWWDGTRVRGDKP